MKGVADGAMMYFVHSYYCEPVEKAAVLATTDYGIILHLLLKKRTFTPFSSIRKKVLKTD